jgi:D-beta-D-heptose 7-phosphate kinase/D-beta-D-heptose 1-phosphate adenosyltransferase
MNIDLSRLMEVCAGLKVVVVGEAMLDIYLEGSIERLCREAPLPVVDIRECKNVPGGGANTAVNVHELGGQVSFLSVVGNDPQGSLLQQTLRDRGIATDGLIVEPGRRTLAKHRLIGGSQMLARFDQGSGGAISRDSEDRLIQHLSQCFAEADAVIVSDYDYGVFSPRLIQSLASLQRRSPRVMVVDSRRPAALSRIGATAIKPSYEEALRLLETPAGPRPPAGPRHSGRAEFVAAQGERVLDHTGAQIAAITLDRDGAVVIERGRPPYRTYARPMRASRCTGAGDTFASALALAAGADTPAAAELASAAAAVVVDKDGTATCSARELRDLISGGDKRVASIEELVARLAFYREQGQRIVFTNGCFDILHRGHVTLLNRAKGLGDVLVVGVNADTSIRRLKGAGRPINSLEDRVKVLAALSYIDHIISFDEDTPSRIIEAIRPDIFVKGGDYTRETLPEAPLVERLGGAVCILPYLEDRSTTGIIERIRQAHG